MAIITLPVDGRGHLRLRFRRVEWGFDVPAQVNRSRWTQRRQVVMQPGPTLITATAELVVAIGEASALAAEAFLIDLEGPVNSFRLAAVENAQMQNYAAEVVDGAGQTGRSIRLRGGVRDTGLRRGHKMTIGDQLVFVMADFTFGADGRATVAFKPSLRASPPDGAPVELRRPTVLMSLAQDAPIGWSVDPGQKYQFKPLQLEEAI